MVFLAFFIYTYSMKNRWLLLLFCIACVPNGWAHPEPDTVREDALLVQKEIQVWRTDLAASSKLPIYNCQAVQLDKDWLLTSAHCVYTACNASLPCTVQITLAEGELRKLAQISHSNNSQSVFIYPGFFPGQNRISSVDIALIHLGSSSTRYAYQMLQEGQWTSISESAFKKQLKFAPETKAQLATRSVRLVSSANLPNSLFLPKLVVPKMTAGNLSYVVSAPAQSYFVAPLQHFISPDLGVRRGNSGGGVFTPQGDLAGLVSSLFFTQDGNASFQNDEGNAVLTLQNARDYFLFTGFNGATLNFIRNRMAYVRTVGALNGYAEPTEKDFQAIVKSIDGKTMSF